MGLKTDRVGDDAFNGRPWLAEGYADGRFRQSRMDAEAFLGEAFAPKRGSDLGLRHVLGRQLLHSVGSSPQIVVRENPNPRISSVSTQIVGERSPFLGRSPQISGIGSDHG